MIMTPGPQLRPRQCSPRQAVIKHHQQTHIRHEDRLEGLSQMRSL